MACLYHRTKSHALARGLMSDLISQAQQRTPWLFLVVGEILHALHGMKDLFFFKFYLQKDLFKQKESVVLRVKTCSVLPGCGVCNSH